MPTLVLNDVPGLLFDQIHQLARVQKRTPADTAVELLQTAFRIVTPVFSEPPPPQEPFLTAEICAPFDLPRPKGKPVFPVQVAAPLPDPHDLPDLE